MEINLNVNKKWSGQVGVLQTIENVLLVHGQKYILKIFQNPWMISVDYIWTRITTRELGSTKRNINYYKHFWIHGSKTNSTLQRNSVSCLLCFSVWLDKWFWKENKKQQFYCSVFWRLQYIIKNCYICTWNKKRIK